MTLKHTILIIPGLRDHVEEHWQTLLAKELTAQSVPCVTVPPLEQDKLSCHARLDAIDRALDSIDGPVIIVAHSAGCMMVAHWALRRARPILGALLAAPADVETQMPTGYPPQGCAGSPRLDAHPAPAPAVSHTAGSQQQ